MKSVRFRPARILSVLALLALAILNPQFSTAFSQGATAFTYQGQLRDGGTNANGAYTMFFALYDANTNGDQIGSTIATSPTLANGLFSVSLDFGAAAFNGGARWLDITVSNDVAETLSPRVPVLPAPYAQFAAVAATVTNGASTTAQLATGAVADANISATTTLTRTLAETNLVIIRGYVTSTGTVGAGQGFSVVSYTNNASTGMLTINVAFSPPFSGIPSITLGLSSTHGTATGGVINDSTTGFTYNAHYQNVTFVLLKNGSPSPA
jgi:hypothetical protein